MSAEEEATRDTLHDILTAVNDITSWHKDFMRRLGQLEHVVKDGKRGRLLRGCVSEAETRRAEVQAIRIGAESITTAGTRQETLNYVRKVEQTLDVTAEIARQLADLDSDGAPIHLPARFWDK